MAIKKYISSYLFILSLVLSLLFFLFHDNYLFAKDGSIAYLHLTEGYWQVWVMDEEGAHSYQITTDAEDKIKISWAGNNQEILYNTNLGELYIINVKSLERKKIPVDIKGTTDAQCSFDGKYICFSANTLNSIDSNDIWITDITGGTVRKITQWPGLQHNPVWADNGKKILFLSGSGGQNHNIFIMDREGKEKKQLTVNALYNFDPACSTKGKVAFSSNRTGNYEIWTMDLSGKNQTQLTHHEAFDGQPTFSPDGKKIAFVSHRNGQQGIWVMDNNGKNCKPLLKGKFKCRSPVWCVY
ncbi:MAG: hypothetical protein ACMUIP_12170 [bacterium]